MATKSIRQRPLGKDGPMLPPMGFGLMGLSIPHYGKVESDEERFTVLDRAVELGAVFWDTADMYADSEDLVGKWFERTGKREQIFLASKFGIKMGPDLKSTFDSSPQYCRESCEKSLARLQTDHIDLYYVHHVNVDVPIEVTMRTLVELKNEGKIKYIGLSNVTSTTVRRAYKIHPIACVQMEYSPFTLDIEQAKSTDLLRTCRELGVAVVCYSPLGRGLLTSTFKDGKFGSDDPTDVRSKVFPRLTAENREANMKLVEEFTRLAEKKGCDTSQLALAWLMKQGNDIFPNPGTKRIKYLEDNWAAIDVELSDEDEKAVRKFVESAEMVGGRLPDQYAHISGDTVEETT